MADKSLFSLPLDELDAYTAGVKESKEHLDGVTNQWKAAARAIKQCQDGVKDFNDALKKAQAGAGANDNLRDRIGPPPSRNDPRTPPRAPPRQDAGEQSQFKQLTESMKSVRDIMAKQSMVMARQMGSYAGAGTSQAIGGVESILSGLGKSNVVAAVVSMAAAAVTAPMLAAFAMAPEVVALRKQAMALSPNVSSSTVRAANVANSWMADPMSGLRAQSDARRGGPAVGAYALGFGGWDKGQAELNSGKSAITQQYDLLDKIVEPMKGMTEFYKNSRVAAFKESGFTKEDIYRYERMKPEERAEKRQIATQVEAAGKGIDDQKWQFFSDKYRAAGEMLELTITKKLQPLLEPLGRLMDKFEGAADDPAIDEFVQGIADAVDSIKKEDITKTIHDTAVALRTMYDAVKAVADFLNKWTGADMQKKIAEKSPINAAHYIDKKYTVGGEGQQVDVGGIVSKIWNTLTDPKKYGWKDKPGLTAPPIAPEQPPPPFHQPAHPHTPTPPHHFWSGWGKKHAAADTPKNMQVAGLNDDAWMKAYIDQHPEVLGDKKKPGILAKAGEKVGKWFKGGEELKPRSMDDMNWGGLAAKYAPPWARGVYNTLAPTPAESGELPLLQSGARPEHPHSRGRMPGYGDRPSADAGAVSFETGNVGGGWKVPGKYAAGTLGGVEAKQTDEPVLSESKKTNELLTQIKDSMDKAGAGEGGLGVGGGGGSGSGGGTATSGAPSGSSGGGGGGGGMFGGVFGGVMKRVRKFVGGGSGVAGGGGSSGGGGASGGYGGSESGGSKSADSDDGGVAKGGPAKGSVASAIFAGESKGDYNIYNQNPQKGRLRVGHMDFSKMTVGEVMRAQSEGKVFAAGAYQVIPKTLAGAVKSLKIDPNTKFDKATQDKIFSGYLATSKKGRGALEAYIKGKSDNSDAALKAAAQEWASIQYHGRGIYDKDGVNHGGISDARMLKAMKSAREIYSKTGNYQGALFGQSDAPLPHSEKAVASAAPSRPVTPTPKGAVAEDAPTAKEAVQAAMPNKNIGWGTEATGGKAGSGGNRGWGSAASRGGYQGGGEQTASNAPLHMGNWQLQPKTNVALSNKTGGDVHISASTMAG